MYPNSTPNLTPQSSLNSIQSSVPWPNAAPALSTLRLEAFGHLSPALCPLSHAPSSSPSLSIYRPRSRCRSRWRCRCRCRCRCSCRACVFFNGFLANVLGAAVGPQQVPRVSSIEFQLRDVLSNATTLGWPNQSFNYREPKPKPNRTLDSKNILEYTVLW